MFGEPKGEVYPAKPRVVLLVEGREPTGGLFDAANNILIVSA